MDNQRRYKMRNPIAVEYMTKNELQQFVSMLMFVIPVSLGSFAFAWWSGAVDNLGGLIGVLAFIGLLVWGETANGRDRRRRGEKPKD
jgi:hypothetical protein